MTKYYQACHRRLLPLTAENAHGNLYSIHHRTTKRPQSNRNVGSLLKSMTMVGQVRENGGVLLKIPVQKSHWYLLWLDLNHIYWQQDHRMMSTLMNLVVHQSSFNDGRIRRPSRLVSRLIMFFPSNPPPPRPRIIRLDNTMISTKVQVNFHWQAVKVSVNIS